MRCIGVANEERAHIHTHVYVQSYRRSKRHISKQKSIKPKLNDEMY